MPHFDHVAVVVLENASFSHVVGNPRMPYLNGLLPQSALATNYFGNFHPSIGNYFMMTVGAGITNDDSFTGTVSDDNLVREMAASSVTWKSYQESIPSAGYLGGNISLYLKRHNPFAYFSDVISNPAEAAKIVPFSPTLASDTASGQLPNLIFISPDAVDDAHSCPSSAPNCTLDDRLANADTWLQTNIAPLLANSGFNTNGVLIITFDEGDETDVAHGGGQVVTMFVGAHVHQGFTSGTFYQHQNLLRTIGDALQLNTIPGAGATANNMAEFFQ